MHPLTRRLLESVYRAPNDPPGATSEAAPAVPAAEAPAAAAAAPEAAPAAAPAAEAPAAPVAEAAKVEAAAEVKQPANEFPPSLLDAAGEKKDEPAAKEGEKPAEAGAQEKPTAEAEKKDAKAEGEKEAPGETPPALSYEFKYPEGMKPEDINAERLSAYTGILGEAKVAPEVGQKLLDLHLTEVGEVSRKLSQHQWDTFLSLQNQWKDDVMADPVVGGSRHQTAIRSAMALIEQYGGDAQERKELLSVMKTTGAANNKYLLRLLARAGDALAREGTPKPATPPRSPAANAGNRGLNRYAKTTPAQLNGAG